MTNNVTSINKKKMPVHYEVHIDHYWDGQFGLSIHGLGSGPDEVSPQSKNTVARALLEVIEKLDPSVLVPVESPPVNKEQQLQAKE